MGNGSGTITAHESVATPLPQHNPSTSTDSSRITVLSYDKDQRAKAEKCLVCKLDTVLLPVLILMCCFASIDKSALGIAKINGIEKDLNMTQRQFNTAVSVFQAGFLVFQLPSNLLITKIPPRWYLSACCGAWSTVATCHCLVKNYEQLLVVRVLLGFSDAPYLIGSLHLLSSWYTRQELAKRTSLILAAVICTMTFSFTISAGIMHNLHGVHGRSGWRWIFLVFGCAGIAIAFLGALLLPSYPESAQRNFWLTEDQQMLARIRIAEDRVDEQRVNRQKLWTGVKLAVKDIRTWIFALMMMSRKSLEGLYYYIPEFVTRAAPTVAPHAQLPPQQMGLLLGAPPAVLAAILAFTFAFTSDKFNERAFHIAVPLSMSIVGTIMTLSSHSLVIRYASIYLWLAGSVVGSGMTWAWVANVVQETPEKKAVGIAIVSLVGGIGSVYGPFLFRGKDAPEYHLAFGFITFFIALDIVCVFTMRWTLGRQNARIKRSAAGDEDVKLYVR